jgi:hypothetical protein
LKRQAIPVSFRKLCARPDLKVSRSTLMNMVRVAAQRQFLIDGGIAEEAVGYSQLVVLTRLENNEEKLTLAQECIDEQLSERGLIIVSATNDDASILFCP